MPAVRDTAKVQVSEPVNGRKRTRGKDRVPRQRPASVRQASPPDTIQPHPLLAQTLAEVMRENEKVRLVSPTEAWLEPLR